MRHLSGSIVLLACGFLLPLQAQTHLVPGTLQAEDYDVGGEGVAYHDSDAGNNGGAYRSEDVDIEFGAGAANQHNIGWIASGEWLRFTAQVVTPAIYQVRYRVASAQTGPFTVRLSVDGKTLDVVNFSGTGGWQNWTNVYSPASFRLEAGSHTVRLDFPSSDLNLDEFEFVVDTSPLPLYRDSSASVSNRVTDLMARMSLDEKVGQMCQASIGFVWPQSDVRNYFLGSLLSGGGEGPSSNTPQAWADMTDFYQAYALSTPLKIPILYGLDAVHGHNNVRGATIFPHNIGMGATRNLDLMKRAAQVTAVEVAATGADWTFAPVVAVAQNEWWGRFYESLSELPDWAGQMGSAAIAGYQGTNLAAPTNILACAKHFAGDGGTTWGTGTNGKMDQGNTVTDEATFRALHLAPYEQAIAAGAMTIMVSYSSWNGIKMHGHTNLLTDVLKGELGFEGLLISDWAGVNQVDPNFSNAVVKSVNAGMDMIMVPDQYQNFLNILRSAVQSGQVSTNRINDAVRRILNVKFQSGVFENPYAPRQLLSEFGSAAHRQVARQAVAESLVVLKDNAGLLPLSKHLTRIHVAGKNAHNLGNQCGGWTITWQGGSGATTVGTTILEGISNAVSPGTSVTYSLDGTGAAGANVGIVVVGETPYAEGAGDTQNLFLSSADLSAINNVRAAGMPVIVILVSGRPMYVESQLSNWNVLIAAWLPGTEGQGVADVLFGDAFPVGVLPHSWPRDNQVPVNWGDPGYNPLFEYGFSVHVSGDRDGDGLTDLWEAQHGLDPYDDGSVNPDFGASGDPDGDGGTNAYEFQTGTHPRLASSIFRIVRVQSSGGTNPPMVRVTANTVPGYRYAIDYADQFPSNPSLWTAFANQSNGFGTWIEAGPVETNHTFIDDFTPLTSGTAAVSHRYYRVSSQKP